MAQLEDYSFGRITVDGEEHTEAVRRYGEADDRSTATALHLTC